MSHSHPLDLLDPAHLPFPQKIIAFCGDSAAVHPLILQSLCIRTARGECPALVIGDNHFDAYRLAHLARKYGMRPGALLSRVSLSRPFTCHQLHHRVHSCTLPNSPRFDALYVLGLLETFYDQDIQTAQAAYLLAETLTHLKQLAAQGLPVLISMAFPKQGGREAFIEQVKRAADVYWQPAPHLLAQDNPQQLVFTGMF